MPRKKTSKKATVKVDTPGERMAVSGSWSSVRRGMLEPRTGPFRMTGPGRTRTRSERDLARQRRLLAGREFATPEEQSAFLAANVQTPAPPTTELEQAQELIYDAWEAGPEKRAELARKALALCPQCADAYLLMAEAAPAGDERVELCRMALKAGRETLNEEPAQATEDQWTRLEARPYLRARAGMARALWEIGRAREAINEYSVLMDLNPGDNLGLRYLVLPLLIEARRMSEALSLARRWGGEPSGEWTYNLALLLFQHEGSTPRATEMLRQALRANPAIPGYLMGLRSLPAHAPDTVSFGGDDEAVDYCHRAQGAWRSVTGALDWLGQHSLEAAS